MSPAATAVALFGGAIFLIAFVWKSRDFFQEAWKDAQANQFPPRKCLLIALAHTTLLWLLIIGSFVVLGVATLKMKSLLMGFLAMGIFAVVVIVLIIKLTNSMPVKARDLMEKDR
jgi:hypothetical protein